MARGTTLNPTPALAPRADTPSTARPDRRWLVLTAVGVGTFMSALNGSIVNAIMPVLMRELRIDFATAEWITMVFLLLVSGLLLSFGRLGDMVGHKRVALAGFGLFILGSVACGLSPTAGWLIGARGFQAVGSAMLMATSPALLTAAFPARQRGRALGLQATFTYLGLMVGPTAGGWLTQRFGWPSIFFLSVPVGLVALALTLFAVAPDAQRERREPFDPAGALLFLIGLTALLLALSHGQDWGWGSSKVIGLLVLALALLGAFLAVEKRVRFPMIDLTLFDVRIIRAATVSALLSYICVYSVTFLMPFYLMRFRGMPPGQAGLLLSAQALTMAITAPLSGALSDRIGSRLPASLGMAVVTVGLVLLATLDAEASLLDIALRLGLLGIGSGLFASPNTSALLGAAPRQRQGIAAAVLGCARNVGMVLGVALAGALFARALAAEGGSLETGAGFVPAFRITFLVVAVFGAVGVVTSLARGPKSEGAQAEAKAS